MHRIMCSFVSLGLLLGFATRSAAQGDPKEVIKKAISAAGGADNLNKFKGSRSSSKGNISIMGLDLEFTSDTVSMYPDRQKTTIKMDVMGNAVTVVQIMNGDKMSVSLNGMNMPVQDGQKAELKKSAAMQRIMNLTPLLEEKGFELKALGETKINDKEVVGIQIACEDLKDLKLYFDKSTYLISKIERMGMDPSGAGEVKQEMFVTEYKEVQGLKKPYKVNMLNDGKKFMESSVTKQELFEKIDDKEFSD